MEQVHVPIDEAMTIAQVGKIQELLGAALRKAGGLHSRIVQRMLEKPGGELAKEMLGVIKANYQQALEEQQLADWVTPIDEHHIIVKMPWFDGGLKTFHFFKVDRPSHAIKDYEDLVREYEKRGLRPACKTDIEILNGQSRQFRRVYPNLTIKRRDRGWGSTWFGPMSHGYNISPEGLDARWVWFGAVPK